MVGDLSGGYHSGYQTVRKCTIYELYYLAINQAKAHRVRQISNKIGSFPESQPCAQKRMSRAPGSVTSASSARAGGSFCILVRPFCVEFQVDVECVSPSRPRKERTTGVPQFSPAERRRWHNRWSNRYGRQIAKGREGGRRKEGSSKTNEKTFSADSSNWRGSRARAGGRMGARERSRHAGDAVVRGADVIPQVCNFSITANTLGKATGENQTIPISINICMYLSLG